MKIERIFYPIGQGAFYAERFLMENGNNFNIVYDCGNDTKALSAAAIISDEIVKQAFFKHDVIDILFISHLDYDHVSKLEILKKSVKKIRYVIMPLLYNKSIMFSFAKANGFENLCVLIESPENFFGENTKVVQVKSDETDQDNLSENHARILLNDLSDDINSNDQIQLFHDKDMMYKWIYVPYNYNSVDNRRTLQEKIEEHKLDYQKLSQKEPDITYIENNLKVLKEIYKKLPNCINVNSLFLYSGPDNNSFNHAQLLLKNCLASINPTSFECRCRMCHSKILKRKKVGAVFTGDGDMNKVNIETVYKTWFNNVGTIQIAHHGSIYNFSKRPIKEGMLCPISYGTRNRYKHPSKKVVSDILSKKAFPIYVNEYIESCFVERIIL